MESMKAEVDEGTIILSTQDVDSGHLVVQANPIHYELRHFP